MPADAPTARLLISCPDRPGIVAAVSRFLFERGANILDSSQHSTDPAGGAFFMRMVFKGAAAMDRDGLTEAFEREVADPFEMRWRLAFSDHRMRMAILASRADHCLLELLWRWRNGELAAEIPLVVSNHDRLRGVVEGFGLPFLHAPVEPDRKPEQEARVLERFAAEGVELVVLARYMQILTPDFVARYPQRIINIHHSFLPAFVGADPYRRAYERGVKLIGATAHYVTDSLDEGPIIAQDVTHVTHRFDLPDLKRVGRDIERVVLARAVAAHLEDRILVHRNKTVVFDGRA